MKRFVWAFPVRLLFGATLLGAGVSTSPAIAQQATISMTDAERNAQAGLLYKKGVEAASEDRVEDARVLLLASWRVKQHWQIAANLGDAELALGRNRDAAEHLEYFLKAGTTITSEERKRGQEMLAKARSRVGTLTIQASVVGAEIFVNGMSVGKAPLTSPIYVEPGRAVVEARLDSYSPGQASAELDAGSTHSMTLRLQRLTSAAPAKSSVGLNKAVLIAGGVTSALAFGVGAATWVVGVEKAGVAPRPEDSHLSQTLVNVATASLAGGCLVGMGTVLYAVTGSRPASGQKAEASFTVSPTAGGVVLGARW